MEVQGFLPLHAPLLLQVSLLLLGELVVEGEAHVQRVVLRLREPQGGLALEADGPERGLALPVGRQLRQLRFPGEPVPQELPLDAVVLLVAGALPVPLHPLLLGPVALRGLLPEALVQHQSSEHLAVAAISSRGHVPRHSVDALALGRRVP